MDEPLLWTLPKKDAINILNICIEGIKKNPEIKKADIKNVVMRSLTTEPLIPLSIFKGDLSPAEALCWYLNKKLGISYRQVGFLLKRDQRTVWLNVTRALSKKLPEAKDSQSVPISAFGKKSFSMLESLIAYLKNEGYSLSSISRMIDKKYGTIASVWSRAKKKSKI